MNLKHLFITAALIVTMNVAANDKFTPLEQQKISIETPGLFDRSDAFTIDFAGMGQSDYCFPLPVGKAKKTGDNYVEISTKHGDAVKAMFAGTVRMSKGHPTLGNTVVVRHDNGLETVYGHNAQNLVQVGERVKAGQTIAIVGGAGGRVFCTFAIMVNGGRINPDIIMNTGSHRLSGRTILFRKADGHVDMSVIHGTAGGKGTAPGRADGTEKTSEPIPTGDNQMLAVSGDPFGGGAKFTLNLANLNPDEWCYPLPSSKVISPYGCRSGRRHTGVDIKTKPNDNILAAFDGVVTMSQSYYGYGNCIRIKHPNGIETLYSHNSKNLVKAGDRVKAGQVIALTGRTGRATTEHLHFECRINGRPFDPAKLFDHANHSIRMDLVTFTKQGGGILIKSEKNYMAKGQ